MLDARRFRKNLLYLIGATRGGPMRARIISELLQGPLNPSQLAKRLKVDYKTVTHHLSVLLKMNWVTRSNERYAELYSVTFTDDERAVFRDLAAELGKGFKM